MGVSFKPTILPTPTTPTSRRVLYSSSLIPPHSKATKGGLLLQLFILE